MSELIAHFDTARGLIGVRLFADDAPVTVANFRHSGRVGDTTIGLISIA